MLHASYHIYMYIRYLLINPRINQKIGQALIAKRLYWSGAVNLVRKKKSLIGEIDCDSGRKFHSLPELSIALLTRKFRPFSQVPSLCLAFYRPQSLANSSKSELKLV